MPNSFDLRLQRARNEIDEALGQRVPDLGPAPNQQPMQLPGNPQITPQGVALSGQQQIGPGTLSGGAIVGPQGFGGGSANYSAPVAGGQFNVGAGVDPQGQFSGAQAEYQRGPFSANVGVQPGGGVSGGLQYRQPFKKGGGVWARVSAGAGAGHQASRERQAGRQVTQVCRAAQELLCAHGRHGGADEGRERQAHAQGAGAA